MFDIKNEVLDAEKRIRPYIKETFLDYSTALSRKTTANVFLKCENLQYTRSFKIRGALNKLLSLTPSQLKQGVVTASSGNHGAAVAFGLKKLNAKGVIFVPENTSLTKIDNINQYTNDLKFYGTDCMHAEMHALEYAKQHNMIYISPYNDREVIGGQGTVGLEIAHQLNSIDSVFVPVGGGGLIVGIAGFLKSINPNIQVIGCLPENSPVMSQSIKAGRIIEMDIRSTLSDATAGGIEAGAITYDLCRQWVDDFILVSEQEIQNAMIDLIKVEHLLIEGAAGVALAAFMKYPQKFNNKNVVVVLSGGNLNIATLKSFFSVEEY